jgi:hypothetical protein
MKVKKKRQMFTFITIYLGKLKQGKMSLKSDQAELVWQTVCLKMISYATFSL